MAVLAYIPLLVIIVGTRPWQRQHLLFFIYLIAAMLWSSSSFLLHSDFFLPQKMALSKFNTCGFILMAVQLYWFSRSFGVGPYAFGLGVGYVLLAMVIALVTLGYLPQSVEVSRGVNVSLGIWLPVIVIPLAFLIFENVLALVRRLNITHDQVQRGRIGYILLGVSIMALFSVSNASEFLRRFPVDHFGNLIAACLWTYATVRHRIVDVRFVARRGLAWAAVIASGIVLYLILEFFFHLATHIRLQLHSVVLGMLGAIITATVIYQLRDPFTRLVDKLFYRETYDYRERLLGFVRHELAGVFTLRDFGAMLLKLLAQGLDCQEAYLLLPAAGSGDFVVEFAEPPEKGRSKRIMRQEAPLAEYLRQENIYLTRERLEIDPRFRGLWSEEIDNLRALDIELLFPLVSRNNLVGVLALGRKRAGRYSLEDIQLAESITNQTAVTLEKEYFQEQLRRREQELSVINRLTTVITSSLNLQEVFDIFFAELSKVVDVDFATVAIIEGDKLQFAAVSAKMGFPWQLREEIPLSGTATEWVSIHRQPLVEPDLTQKARFWTGNEYLRHGIRSTAYLPLIVRGEVIGSFIFGSRHPNVYTPEHVSLMEHLTSQIAVAVENSRLYARAEQRARVDELTGLYNRRHFDECLKQEIDRHYRCGGMFSLVLLDLDNLKDYNDKEGHMAGDKVLSQIGRLLRKVIRTSDLAFRYGGDEFAIILPQSSDDNAFMVAERVRGTIAHEMERMAIGITASLGLASWPSDGVSSDEIVAAADMALYHAKRTGQNRTCTVASMTPAVFGMETGHREVRTDERDALNMVYALTSTIEARDANTYGHSQKVAKYAVALAEALGLPAERVATISTAALLHDIGKIGVPDEILLKNGKLDAEEWEVMQQHPRLSAAIVGHVVSLSPCLPAILHHHERWDGSGYPSKLKGEAIPLEARILAIADAFDGMTSPRPYREPPSRTRALNELKRNSGAQFDPRLIEVFLPIAASMLAEELEVGEDRGGFRAAS